MSEDNIEITEKDLIKAEQDSLIVVLETDLIGQRSTVQMSDKPFDLKNWNPDLAPPTKKAVDIVLLIDTSGSMGADDYKPNRLEAAKEAAKMFTKRKVMRNYGNDRVSVIGFGGAPFMFHPLDKDLDKAADAIDKLRITHSGTQIGAALNAGLQELLRGKSERLAVILLSDGGDEKYDSSKPRKIAASMKGIKVFTIGIATMKGGMATLPHGREKVGLNEGLLQFIAKTTGGEYVYAPDVIELQRLYTKLADY